MASAITHFVVGAGLALPLTAVGRVTGTLRPAGVVVAAGLLGALPDLDALLRGMLHPDILHHRGATHAPVVLAAFCLGLAVCLGLLVRRLPPSSVVLLGGTWALAAISHPLLDAMTNGGPGVLLLYPFSEQRLFFPWRPLEVAPLSISRFPRAAARVLSSELPFALGAVCLGLAGRFLVKVATRPSKARSAEPGFGLN